MSLTSQPSQPFSAFWTLLIPLPLIYVTLLKIVFKKCVSTWALKTRKIRLFGTSLNKAICHFLRECHLLFQKKKKNEKIFFEFYSDFISMKKYFSNFMSMKKYFSNFISMKIFFSNAISVKKYFRILFRWKNNFRILLEIFRLKIFIWIFIWIFIVFRKSRWHPLRFFIAENKSK